jgi:hypothetical protein
LIILRGLFIKRQKLSLRIGKGEILEDYEGLLAGSDAVEGLDEDGIGCDSLVDLLELTQFGL